MIQQRAPVPPRRTGSGIDRQDARQLRKGARRAPGKRVRGRVVAVVCVVAMAVVAVVVPIFLFDALHRRHHVYVMDGISGGGGGGAQQPQKHVFQHLETWTGARAEGKERRRDLEGGTLGGVEQGGVRRRSPPSASAGDVTKDERPLPRQQEDEEDSGFAACLMIMDDNHFLVEWLAYHYFALPLRHLTVYVDESSRTSPMPIFDRWRGRIEIDVWNSTSEFGFEDRGDPGLMVPIPPYPRYLERYPQIRNYLGRQNAFYEGCMKSYKKRNWKSWLLFIDTDEYISVNKTRSGNVDRDGAAEAGSVMRALKEVVAQQQRQQQQKGAAGGSEGAVVDCINTRRTQICYRETNSTAGTDSHYSSSQANQLGIDPSRDLLTHRWLLSDGPMGWRTPKSMIYVPAISQQYLDRGIDLIRRGSAHRLLPGLYPMGGMCPTRDYFQIYHYHGSREQFEYKDRYDPRGSHQHRAGGSRLLGFDTCRGFPAGDLRPWLRGFVDRIAGGADEARRLLAGAGKVDGWLPYSSNTSQHEQVQRNSATVER